MLLLLLPCSQSPTFLFIVVPAIMRKACRTCKRISRTVWYGLDILQLGRLHSEALSIKCLERTSTSRRGSQLAMPFKELIVFADPKSLRIQFVVYEEPFAGNVMKSLSLRISNHLKEWKSLKNLKAWIWFSRCAKRIKRGNEWHIKGLSGIWPLLGVSGWSYKPL